MQRSRSGIIGTRLRMTCVFACLSLLATSMPQAAESAASVASPELNVAGKSQAQWSEEWWKWAASFDDDESPIIDRSGDLCASGQQGSVWFLAGVYGSAPVKRECTIPADKWIFFPIVNYVVASASGCAAAVETAREYT